MTDETTTTDQVLTCIDCQQPFTWTVGEQSYYADKRLHAPRRCKPCRAAKRLQREIAAYGG